MAYEEKVKKLGQVFTPPEIANFIARWAIRNPFEKVLDPGCGEGIFIKAAVERFKQLGVRPTKALEQIFGVEVEKDSLSSLKAWLEAEYGRLPHIVERSFFEVPSPREALLPEIPQVEVVIGNPPYIRYQLFKGRERERALRIARNAGVKLTELTSSWAPFLIHAASFLSPEGRMGFVIPAKVLHAGYAEEFRRWLLESFEKVIVVSFEERVFKGVLEDVVLLLAEKRSSRRGVALMKAKSEKELKELEETVLGGLYPISTLSYKGKWLRYLIPAEHAEVLGQLYEKQALCSLRAYGDVDIGVVTGCNNFFLVSDSEVERWSIELDFLRPVVFKAEHIKGLSYTEKDWRLLKESGGKCYLLYIDAHEEAVRAYNVWRYLKHGLENLGVTSRFKVRIRKPWYKVPYVRTPDAFLTYMAHEMPRLSLNEAGAINTNTIHSVMLKRVPDRRALAVVFHNTFTMLSCEVMGRYYGGGVLKLEPGEAEKLLVPRLSDECLIKDLRDAFNKVDRLIRAGLQEEALRVVDEIILNHIQISRDLYGKAVQAYKALKKNRLCKARKLHSIAKTGT